MREITRRAVLRAGGMLATVGVMGRGLPVLGQGGSVGSGLAGGATVRTAGGQLRGTVEGSGVRVFRGIPFAEPPVGALRFRPPVRSKGWTGVREAGAFRPMAVQSVNGRVQGSEDCLYLNVWAPAGAGPFPVFVWIHGGGYTGGAAAAPIFDGTEFAGDGVVLVTVAYRLGVFGFLDLGPLLGPEYGGGGNNALRDLTMALGWVRENIAAFGGDPGKVTVGGESAGAKATAALLAIGEARGMFGAAISESGGGERVGARARAAAGGGPRGRGGGAGEAGGGVVPELKTAAAERLIAAQVRLIEQSARHFPFRPEVDGSYLAGRPVDVVAKGSMRGERMLIGTNRDESALFLGPHPAADPTARDLGNLSLGKFDAVFAKYAALYPEMTEAQRRVRAVTAEEYWVPSVRLAEAHVGAGGEAWMYRLDYAKTKGRMAGEAYHSEDVRLVFDKPDTEDDAAGVSLGRQMHAAWVAFIKGEVPAAQGLPVWPGYRGGERRTMVLDRVSRVEERPMETELRLWDGVL